MATDFRLYQNLPTTTELGKKSGADGDDDDDGDALMVMAATADGLQGPYQDHDDDVSFKSASGIGTVSDIYPGDSISVRDLNRRRHPFSWIAADEESSEPSVVSFRSQGE